MRYCLVIAECWKNKLNFRTIFLSKHKTTAFSWDLSDQNCVLTFFLMTYIDLVYESQVVSTILKEWGEKLAKIFVIFSLFNRGIKTLFNFVWTDNYKWLGIVLLTNRKTGRTDVNKHVNKRISRPFVKKISMMLCKLLCLILSSHLPIGKLNKPISLTIYNCKAVFFFPHEKREKKKMRMN